VNVATAVQHAVNVVKIMPTQNVVARKKWIAIAVEGVVENRKRLSVVPTGLKMFGILYFQALKCLAKFLSPLSGAFL